MSVRRSTRGNSRWMKKYREMSIWVLRREIIEGIFSVLARTIRLIFPKLPKNTLKTTTANIAAKIEDTIGKLAAI